MKKLLLHTCCAPCLSGTHPVLAREGFSITGYFYNPNIQPQDELVRRLVALREYLALKNIDPMIIDNYDDGLFEKEVVGKPGDRCRNCYSLRMNATASYAEKNGFDAFSTTLLLSPYQKHDIIRGVGEEISRKYGVEFYYHDLRPFYGESVRISKMMGLYRQKHCGCYLSREKKDEQVSFASR